MTEEEKQEKTIWPFGLLINQSNKTGEIMEAFLYYRGEGAKSGDAVFSLFLNERAKLFIQNQIDLHQK